MILKRAEAAFLEQIDGALVAFEVADVFLERGERGAAQAEDEKEVIPESLLLRALRAVARVLAGEADGAVADFVPGEGGMAGEVLRDASFLEVGRGHAGPRGR